MFLLIPSDGKVSLSQSVDNQKIERLMTQLLWVMAEEETYITTIRNKDMVNDISFSPDGTYLATASGNIVKLLNLRKLSQLVDEQKNQPTPLFPQTTAIVHIEQPEAFFVAWLRTESNHHSFYEYMVTQAQQSHDGLSVKYSLPILDTNLLL